MAIRMIATTPGAIIALLMADLWDTAVNIHGGFFEIYLCPNDEQE